MKAESDRAIATSLHVPSGGGRRTAVGLVAMATIVGLVLRLAFALGYWVDKPLTNDEQEYLLLARSLARGTGFAYPPPSEGGAVVERFGRAPFYPFVLSQIAGVALVETMPSSVPAPVKTRQSVIGALAIPLLAILAWWMAGPSAGTVAALLAAVHPPLVWTSAYALSEVVYVVVIWASVVLLSLASDRRRPAPSGREAAMVLLAGLLGGIAALTRPSALAYVGIGTLWLAVARRRLAALFMIGAMVAIVPWTARNMREHARFVLIAPEGGINFWVGNHPLARGEGDMAANPAIKRANEALRLEHATLSPEELDSVYYRETVSHILTHPLQWVGLLARKLFYLVIPVGPSYGLHSRIYQAGSIVPYLLLLPMAMAGVRVIRRMRAPAGGLWVIFASSVLVYLVFFPQERYRIPEIDPTLIVLGAVWIGRWRPVRNWFDRGV